MAGSSNMLCRTARPAQRSVEVSGDVVGLPGLQIDPQFRQAEQRIAQPADRQAVAGQDERQARLGRGFQLGQADQVRDHAVSRPIGVVDEDHGIDLLIAKGGQAVAQCPPQHGRRVAAIEIAAELGGQRPEHFIAADARQVDPGDRRSAAAKLIGEDFQQQRLAASFRPQEQAQPAVLLDQEVQPRQGLFVRGTLIEGLRIETIVKRRFPQTPMRLVHGNLPASW